MLYLGKNKDGEEHTHTIIILYMHKISLGELGQG